MTKRKGNAPGQGRQPTIAPRGQVTKITARVSEKQRAEYINRGGSQALREWLDTDPNYGRNLPRAGLFFAEEKGG
jgi:hypothetical protein